MKSSTKQSNRILHTKYIQIILNQHYTMSIVPTLFSGRRSSIFDPFSLDLWDPFRDFPFSPSSDVDLPGIKKEEVKVEVEDGNILQITGERNIEKENKNDKWHRRVKRSSGKFTRRFRLPENAKMDQVKVAMENGVLTITVPKEEAKKPDVKSIEIFG
ncbi:putative small heat shock protein HSP20 [Helianthus debilis subsp. tardiflorus]